MRELGTRDVRKDGKSELAGVFLVHLRVCVRDVGLEGMRRGQDNTILGRSRVFHRQHSGGQVSHACDRRRVMLKQLGKRQLERRRNHHAWADMKGRRCEREFAGEGRCYTAVYRWRGMWAKAGCRVRDMRLLSLY